MHTSFSAPIATFVGLAFLVVPLLDPPALAQGGGGQGSYALLTDTREDYTNFNIETVRGLARSGDKLYALNTHGSQVVVTTVTGPPTPPVVWNTINNPVALAIWGQRVLVLGGSTHALVSHDIATGAIKDMIEVPNEPGDLVVDPASNRAYVSSQAENSVVRIHLATSGMTFGANFRVNAQRPRFLFLDKFGSLYNRVTVAPMLSGNGSTHDLVGLAHVGEIPGGTTGLLGIYENIFQIKLAEPGGTEELATDTATRLALGRIVGNDEMQVKLPDQDLHSIPLLPNSPSGGADPCFAGLSTLILDHGRNPATQAYWVLGVELHNDTENFTESDITGAFATNTVTIVTTVGNQGCSVTSKSTVDVDQYLGNPVPAHLALSFPYALEFISGTNTAADGFALIAGSTSDTVGVFTQTGTRTGITISLPDGSIPRDLLFDPSSKLLYVYCWGTNEVRRYDCAPTIASSGPPVFLAPSISLGLDPASVSERRGREIWYDATPSKSHTAPEKNGRTSCNSCHPDLGSDHLAWQLSDAPNDHKEIMVTQSLRSIVDTPNYHWRGERTLPQFNQAFPGLLGHCESPSLKPGELSATDLGDFVSFIFSVHGQANSNQDEDRELNSSIVLGPYGGLTPDAVQGQSLFLTKQSTTLGSVEGSLSCNDCHSMPFGTRGIESLDEPHFIGTARTLDVPHLRQLNHKVRQPLSSVTYNSLVNLFNPPVPVTELRPRGGFGFTHTGETNTLFDFIKPPSFSLTNQEAANITAFVEQFDQGVSPGAHAAVLMKGSNAATAEARVQTLLINQALAPKQWIDVVALSYDQAATPGSHAKHIRWLYQVSGPNAGKFEPSEDDFPVRTLADFKALALASPSQPYVFLGLPPGNGRRFALDPDNDMWKDYDTVVPGTFLPDPSRFDPDIDGDGYPDGYEALNGSAWWLATITPTETNPPQFQPGSPVLEHVQGSFAKFFVAAEELVSVEIVAESTDFLTTLVGRSDTMQLQHTVVVQGLKPSTTGMPPNKYKITVKITDLKGNWTSTDVIGQIATLTIPPDGDGDPATLLDPTRFMKVGALSWTTTQFPPSAGLVIVSGAISVRVESVEEQQTNPVGNEGMPGRYVLGQFVKRAKQTDPCGPVPEWVTVSLADVSSAPPAVGDVQSIQVLYPGAPAPADYRFLSGPYLLSGATNSLGDATIPYVVNNLAAGDELRFNVLAIVKPFSAQNPIQAPIPVVDLFSIGDWMMPTTPEDRRSKTYIVTGP